MRGKIVLAVLLCGCLLSCQSGPEPQKPKAPRKVRKVKKKTTKQTKPPQLAKEKKEDVPVFKPDPALDKTPEGKLLKNFAKQYTLYQQKKKAAADHYYKAALEHYKALRYRLAERELLLCLENDPNHQEAKLLLQRVRYILGDQMGSVHDLARDYTQEVNVKIAQAKVEMERLFARAKLNFKQQQYKKAEELFHKVLEISEWFPYHIVDEAFVEKVKNWIRRTQKARKRHELELKRKLQEAAQSQAQFLYAKNLKYIAARVRALYRQAILAFQQEEYNTVIDICDEILRIRPTFTKAKLLKQRAINARHVQKVQRNIREQSEHFARQIESIHASAVPYQEVFRFPDREEWKRILNRAVQVTSFIEEVEEGTELEKDIKNRLENQVISLTLEKKKLEEAIAILRRMTHLNFVITNSAQQLMEERELTVTLRSVRGMKIKSVLAHILRADPELTYKIKNGAVYIVTKAQAADKKIIHYYNVSDIITPLPDFPAPKLALSVGNRNTAGAAGGGGGLLGGGDDEEEDQAKGGRIGPEKLKELISKTILKQDDSEGVSITNGVLIVRQTLEVHKKIQKLLDSLRRTVGIMITLEVRFIDIQDNLLEEIGVDYRGLSPQIANIDGSARNVNVGYRRLSSSGNNDIRAVLVNQFTQGLGTTSNNPFNFTSVGGLAIQYNKLSNYQIQAIFEAVKKKQRARLVTAPRLNVFNTQRAHVLSIRQRAFISDIQVESSGVVPVLNPVIDVLNYGTILDARPTVSYDRKYVTLQVLPTLAEDRTTAADRSLLQLAGGNTQIPIELPNLTVYRIQTTVTVPDGGTILLGGLKNYIRQSKMTGIPILSSIPLLKNLVSRRGWAHLRRNLIVLLTVKIHDLRELEKRKFGGLHLRQ